MEILVAVCLGGWVIFTGIFFRSFIQREINERKNSK